ncbi:unnamed protein product [Auanema sp. JU1783]|nr:unnamed protein product [Auanema sp. JU1783]
MSFTFNNKLTEASQTLFISGANVAPELFVPSVPCKAEVVDVTGAKARNSNSFDFIGFISNSIEELDNLASEAYRLAKPGAIVEAVVSNVAEEDIRKKVRLAGFSNEQGVSNESGTRVTFEKPSFAGQTFALKLPQNDDDIIDEDDLLADEDYQKPTESDLKAACGDPAEAKKKRACKNCTCGLAEMEEQEKKQQQPVKSSCGNCSLGDAFRCASCPYLGMPPFKKEDNIIKLDNVDDF